MVFEQTKTEEMGVVTRAQSEHLAKLKINEFLEKHSLLRTRELRLRNIVQLFDFLSSLEASVFVCRNAAFGHAVAKKIFESNNLRMHSSMGCEAVCTLFHRLHARGR